MKNGGRGKVWLLGAGPGGPELLTLKGKEILEAAEVVVHDRLVSEEILASIPAGVRIIDAGKRRGKHPVPQEEINRILIDEARRGRKVVRLKGGDPFLFGRGGEECLKLAEEGIPFEVIPGLSSALAVPACAGIPLTHRGISAALHIITWQGRDGNHPEPEVLRSLAQAGGTLVILMGASALGDMGPCLLEAGFAPGLSAALIENGASPHSRVRLIPLNRLAETGECNTPALVVVGEVCSLARRLSPPEDMPLKGLRFIVTRQEPQNADLCRKIRALGGEALPFPCVKTVPWGNPEDRIYAEAGRYSWIVFTSASGAEIFFDRCLLGRVDFRRLSGCRFAVVGPATAETLGKRGFIPDLMPSSYNARRLGEELAEKMDPHEEALLVRSRRGAPGLSEALAEKGRAFRELPVYDTIPPEGGGCARKIIEAGRFDYVFFTSASGVSAFAGAFPRIDFPGLKALCIGEPTARRAREFGMTAYTAAEAATGGLCALACELAAKFSAL